MLTVMKTSQHRTENLQRNRFEADLEATIKALFRNCPTLSGFSIQDGTRLSHGKEICQLEGELFLTDVGVHPGRGDDVPEEIYGEIAVALLELIDESPEARQLLLGRTFARVFH